jgi:AcrR family transcriptional regulator
VPQLRVDAQDNRDRILAAARELFSEAGLGVSMRQIARRAGVGPATLYRRFPTKQDMVDEAFSLELQACREIVHAGCADPEPWCGFVSVVHGLIALNARNRGFVHAFTSTEVIQGEIAEHRRDLLRMLGRLARRAQDTGSLRADFTIDDLVLVLQAGRGIPSARSGADLAHRFATIVVDGLRAPAGAVARRGLDRVPSRP